MAKKSTRLEALHQTFEENGISPNANEWGEIESFAKRKEKWLRRYPELPYGIPELSGKTDDIYEKSIVSVDGKENRGSKRKNSGQGEVRALQTLNVHSNDYGICLVRKFIKEKTNEIPAAQEILQLMDLKDMREGL